jgi:cobalt-zinc-cadmium efflux system outer membrane protein
MRIERPACIAGPFLVVLTAGLMAAGCVGPPSNRATSTSNRPSDAGVAALELVSGPNRDASQPRVSSHPDSPLTLQGALKRALEESPELASRAWEQRGRDARAVQAGLAPNPELQAETENFAGSGAFSGFGASETTLALAQRLETAGKRGKRRRAAELGADAAAWQVEEARLRVVEQVTRAFAGVVAAQQAVSVTTEQVEIAASSERATRRLVDAGGAPPVEATRARVAVSTARIDRVRAVRQLEAARAELARTWGSATTDFAEVVGEVGPVMPPRDLEELRALLAHHPALSAWDQEVARREALVELEDARRVPDVTAAAGVRWLAEPDDAALVAGFSIPLPLFDRNQGDRAAARADLRRARSERRAEEAALGTELERVYQELAARHEEIVELGEEILPAAGAAFDGVRDGYRRGLFRNTDVLEAQRTLVELRLREIDAVRAYHVARAALERLTAGARVQP